MTYQNNTTSETTPTTFYRIPKALFADSCFREISLSAKMLYGMLLDRMTLSTRNAWQDGGGQVFVYFTLEEAQEQLCCGHSKAVRLFAELESSGLIRRKRQGQGKPAKIYARDLPADVQAAEQASETDAAELSENDTFGGEDGPMQTSGQLENSLPEVLFSGGQLDENDIFEPAIPKKQTSGLPETSSAEASKPDANKTEINYTEMNETDLIYPPYIPPSALDRPDGPIDPMDGIEGYKAWIKANIDYGILVKQRLNDRELIDGYVELMAEACASRRKTIRISREDFPAEAVRSRFLKVNSEHIGYVLDCMKHTVSSIGNIKAYTLAALYNAPATMEQYYASLVSRDFGEVI